MAAGMSYHNPKYFSNRAHVSCKTTLAPRTISLVYRAYRYPIAIWGSGAFLLHGPIIGLGR
jgi:hypothetical protein